jgi:hypothetical protein
MADLFSVKRLRPSGKTGQIAPGLILVPDTAPVPVQTNFITPSLNPSALSPTSSIPVEAVNTASTAAKKGIISFVENYNSWSNSPILNDIYDNKIPFIHLKESRLLNSTLFQQFKYFQHYKFFGRVEDSVGDVFGDGSFITEVIQGATTYLEFQYKIIETVADWLVGARLPDLRINFAEDPYADIYDSTLTGFEYILPFFSEDAFQKTAMYRDTYSGDMPGNSPPGTSESPDIRERLERINTEATERSQSIRALVEPGLFIEKPKFYDFGQNRESISFSFPLLNTQSIEQIQQNYQFLFLLLFQNSMYRKDRAAFIPPCLYEVLIPGTRYMKHACVSNLKVDFLGTRRMIKIRVPNIDDNGKKPGSIETSVIIPEVYNVKIELETLHEETGNYLFRGSGNNFADVELLTKREIAK